MLMAFSKILVFTSIFSLCSTTGGNTATTTCLPQIDQPKTNTQLDVVFVSNKNSDIPDEQISLLYSHLECALEENYDIKPKISHWHIKNDKCFIGSDDVVNEGDQSETGTSACSIISTIKKCIQTVPSTFTQHIVFTLDEDDLVDFSSCNFEHSYYFVIISFNSGFVETLPKNMSLIKFDDRDDFLPNDPFTMSESSVDLLSDAFHHRQTFGAELYNHFKAVNRVAKNLPPYELPLEIDRGFDDENEGKVISTKPTSPITIAVKVSEASTTKASQLDQVVKRDIGANETVKKDDVNGTSDVENVFIPPKTDESKTSTLASTQNLPETSTITETDKPTETTPTISEFTSEKSKNNTESNLKIVNNSDEDEKKDDETKTAGADPTFLVKIAQAFGDDSNGILYILFCCFTCGSLLFGVVMFILCLWPKYYHDEPVSRQPKKGVPAAKLLVKPQPPKRLSTEQPLSKTKTPHPKETTSSEKTTVSNTQQPSDAADNPKTANITTAKGDSMPKTSATNAEQSPVQLSTPDDVFAGNVVTPHENAYVIKPETGGIVTPVLATPSPAVSKTTVSVEMPPDAKDPPSSVQFANNTQRVFNPPSLIPASSETSAGG